MPDRKIVTNALETTVSCQPGRLKVDTERSVWMMTQVPAEFGVVFLPAVLLIDHVRGRAAKCVRGCVPGAQERLSSARHRCEDRVGVGVYGQSPRWDVTFRGHCVLCRPELGRLVDPTIQQFPELAGADGPFIGRLGAANHAMSAELSVGTSVPVVRDGAHLVYQVVGDEVLIMESEPAAHAAPLNPRSAANLAGWALSIMAVPEIASRVREAPFPLVHALIDAIDDAEVDAGPTGYRFILPGADGQLTPTWIDEIPVG